MSDSSPHLRRLPAPTRPPGHAPLTAAPLSPVSAPFSSEERDSPRVFAAGVVMFGLFVIGVAAIWWSVSR